MLGIITTTINYYYYTEEKEDEEEKKDDDDESYTTCNIKCNELTYGLLQQIFHYYDYMQLWGPSSSPVFFIFSPFGLLSVSKSET